MGKKSKNPNKKSNKSNAQTAHSTLQELQSGIDSMSMNDAFAAVKMATNSINQMKEEQKRAAEQLKAARAAVEKSKLDKSNNDLYADVNFWEKRYQDEASASSSTTTEIYEWYLDFSEIVTMLKPDIEDARETIAATGGLNTVTVGEVLVAGCGNSSMCEDLHMAGVRGVCGMDYSPSVIAAMNQRLDTPALRVLKESGVRYICADGTAMPSDMTATCSAVVDKGTLDAITSGGVEEAAATAKKGSDSAGTRDALAYMKEMWRILQSGGVFVIISTMPPHLFHLVGSEIVPALANESSSNDQQKSVRTGDGYRINSFTTKEGGSVFYYALFKPLASRTSKSYLLCARLSFYKAYRVLE